MFQSPPTSRKTPGSRKIVFPQSPRYMSVLVFYSSTFLGLSSSGYNIQVILKYVFSLNTIIRLSHGPELSDPRIPRTCRSEGFQGRFRCRDGTSLQFVQVALRSDELFGLGAPPMAMEALPGDFLLV